MSFYSVSDSRSQTHREVWKNVLVEVEESTPCGFESRVRDAIEKISFGEVGQRLLKKIGENRHVVVIKYDGEGKSMTLRGPVYRDGGWDSTITISDGESMLGFHAEEIESPFFIYLAHELIHAHHLSSGKYAESHTADEKIWTNDEEYKTVMGFPSENPSRKNPKISENAIRAEHDLPLRYSHHSVCSNLEKRQDVQMSATAHRVSSVFEQVVLGKSVHQIPVTGKVHQVSLKAIMGLKQQS